MVDDRIQSDTSAKIVGNSTAETHSDFNVRPVQTSWNSNIQVCESGCSGNAVQQKTCSGSPFTRNIPTSRLDASTLSDLSARPVQNSRNSTAKTWSKVIQFFSSSDGFQQCQQRKEAASLSDLNARQAQTSWNSTANTWHLLLVGVALVLPLQKDPEWTFWHCFHSATWMRDRYKRPEKFNRRHLTSVAPAAAM